MPLKNLLSTISFLFLSHNFVFSKTTDTRSDSVEIINYSIYLDITNLPSKTISGRCIIMLKPEFSNISKIRLDLLRLNVTGIKQDQLTATYSYNDTLLVINLPNPLVVGDSSEIEVSYNGQPKTDGSSFGGFYFSGVYAFNLGVGFAADPHTFGRAWFPCFDNFTSRSTYDFYITTDSGYMAICNGLLESVQSSPGKTSWHWKLNQTIPTYLASVAVAPYSPVNQSYPGLNGDIPVILAAIPADTTKMKASFININKGMDGFETAYGPYLFDRVGFTAVPFNGGAMEHATSIAYPLFAIDGQLTYETLWAHELSHHWWGDLVTCRTQEDMWINEGFASYSEKVFLEFVYGKDRYKQDVRNNHLYVLHFANLADNGYRAVSGVPHAYTYGAHVYKKGADVAHTLRGYMGDTAFFAGVKDFMNTFKFKDVNSDDLKNSLQQNTTADLSSFFNNWVYQAGFPHFSTGAYSVTPAGSNFDVSMRIDQKLKAAPALYTNVPLEITFYDAAWNKEQRKINAGGTSTDANFTLSFNPVFYAIDMEEKISDAITDQFKIIKNAGVNNFDNALMSINVSSISDSALLRIEHHWVGPGIGAGSVPGAYLSDSRYWSVDGILPGNFIASAFVTYDGRTPAAKTSGYLDNSYIRITEDSLVLLYRPNFASAWQVYPDYVKNMGNKTDKTGSININNLKKGDYVLAMYDQKLGLKQPESLKKYLKVFPNPAGNLLIIEFGDLEESSVLRVTDARGVAIAEHIITTGQKSTGLDTSTWSNGIYFISLSGSNGQHYATEKIIKE